MSKARNKKRNKGKLYLSYYRKGDRRRANMLRNREARRELYERTNPKGI